MIATRSMDFERTIAAPARDLFAILADLAGTTRWLPSSTMFGGVKEIAPDPCRLGTTFVDYGRLGKRYGTIIEFTPESCIAFHQPMVFKAPVPGTVDVRVRYTLEPRENATVVRRHLDAELTINGPGKILGPLIFDAIRRENERVMSALKRYAESPDRTPAQDMADIARA